MSKPADLFTAAEQVLCHSYSPYSNFPVASAIRSTNGRIFAGVNVENVSFRLTCCAEQSAISSMVSQGDHAIAEVLILVPGPELCPPCGACRQTILEFAAPDALIHICTIHENKHAVMTCSDLLPGSFTQESMGETS